MNGQQTTKRVRGILYCRYSPRPKDSDSIEAQTADLVDYCEKNNIDPFVVCFDAQTSGTVSMFQRPGLSQALRLLRRGDAFVIRNNNRSARSLVVALAIEDEVNRLGAELHSIENGGLQVSRKRDRNAWMLRVIGYLISDIQREESNERTARRMQQHIKAGRSMGTPRYGRMVINGPVVDGVVTRRIVDNPDEQRVISEVLDMHNQGMSAKQIINHMNTYPANYPPRGNSWKKTSVVRIIRYANGEAKV